MGYLHINNLYKDQKILLMKECFVLEKIHGTSSHISYKDKKLNFFSGGESHEKFVNLFDKEKLLEGFEKLGADDITIYGEAYGGKQQGMSHTYGKELKFIAFDVKIGYSWLNVPDAEDIVKGLGLEFVWYTKSSTDIEELNKYRDMDSPQAKRNGIDESKIMEGVVLRPIFELTQNNGTRLISKHKRAEFRENKTDKVVDTTKLEIIKEANAIAEEWVTPMRLNHVLDKIPGHKIEMMRDIIKAMVDDVYREGEGEIVESQAAYAAIGKRTAMLYKELLQNNIGVN